MYRESGGELTESFSIGEWTNHDESFGAASPHNPRPLAATTGLIGADPPKDEKALAEEFRVFAKREAAAYTIRLEGSDRPLTLRLSRS